MKTELHSWTWGEFKDKMESAGIADYDRLWYIDINIESTEPVNIQTDHQRGVEVTNYPDIVKP